MTRLVVLGSTGSVGTACLDVVREHRDRIEVVALAAGSRVDAIADQAAEFRPEVCAIADPAAENSLSQALAARGVGHIRVLAGPEALPSLARSAEVDCVVSAVTGAIGLPASVAALESGKRLALANKESLVMAGSWLMDLASRHGGKILPVDSEHSAILQALDGGRPDEVRKIILTASGGPFRGASAADLERVTPAEALRHPTWQMGPKISIDSATLMNKALEVIEARWLFGVSTDELEVVVHPQSIVHSMVEFRDGSILAQLSEPDMRVPIQYAISWPDRWHRTEPRFDVRQMAELTFEKPDNDRFPALRLGFEVAAAGGTLGAVFNAANEVAVEAFLAGRLPFVAIARSVESVLSAHENASADSLEAILEADRWAREYSATHAMRDGAVH